MNTGILGTGWVTPLGRDVNTVAAAMLAGCQPAPSSLPDRPQWPVWRIPGEDVRDAAALPRLRRSSVISHFAVTAARDAVDSAALDAAALSRCALVFVSSDGGVVYTRRFYEDIIRRGPGAGSPILFPETVYNAPASHVAASLGLCNEVLTLVGEAPTGLSALHTARELLSSPSIEFCLVVAAQELDWISAEAYGRWRLIKTDSGSSLPPFSEGAAAILLGRHSAPTSILHSHPGLNVGGSRRIHHAFRDILRSFDSTAGVRLTVTGGPADGEALASCREFLPSDRLLDVKSTLGESLVVSAVQQVIFADWLLKKDSPGNALVAARGHNDEVNALVLTR